jgi:superfamily II DNA or RNA helicase
VSFAVGSLVRARGREWVVLPESEDQLLVLRPLGGTEDEVTGIYLPLETVEPATFGLPEPSKPGDHLSCRLLRDALRLSFRSSAGPFRSFARIAVEPRPYQLVPLLMALRLDPVRLLIADDVGIGKTVEAALVARELLDRGEVNRMVVLCPPQLAEQWQEELRTKFNIDAELVLASTAARLERSCGLDQSIFDVFPRLVVSIDFIKSDRRREDFLRACPELVIVDEAHSCAFSRAGRGGRHQRYQLLKGLASDPDRHLILVTATPHSGKEDAFRSLLAFLEPEFAHLPADLAGEENEHHRRRLAAHLVQRRRPDIRSYLDTETPFPEREDKEESYQLSPEYHQLFEHMLRYARETVRVPDENRFRQRVRWWSALALLRSLASSPVAAAATLRNRSAVADAESEEAVEEIGIRSVMDQLDDDPEQAVDTTPGAESGEEFEEARNSRKRRLEMARMADALIGEKDLKLTKAVGLIQSLLDEGFSPIIFCRFIATAEYVADQLRRRLRDQVEVAAVTGTLPPAEREERVAELVKAPKRVLVCTDCLSEGINLQQGFDAVFHYDLTWNPTRHEQREGRVDRYGQTKSKIRVLTYYGIDNQIDGIVLDVLLRKHKTIRNSLGVSVAVPVDPEKVMEAVFEGLLLREQAGRTDLQLTMFDDFFKPRREELHRDWESAASREKRSRTMFAQQTIKVEAVSQELSEARDAVGSGADAAAFLELAVKSHRGLVNRNGDYRIDLSETPRGLKDAMGCPDKFSARFELPVQEDQVLLTRTHPFIEGLANYVIDTALDPQLEGGARRCGAIRTASVRIRTTLLLVRYRFHIMTLRAGNDKSLLAEEVQLLGFTGAPDNARWIDSDEARKLLEAVPAGSILPEQASHSVQRILDGYPHLERRIVEHADLRAAELLESHQRVRQATRMRGIRYRVDPQLPADLLGIYVYLPAGA